MSTIINLVQSVGIPLNAKNILKLRVFNNYAVLQFTPESRGQWVMDHDNDEYLIYDLNNRFFECEDIINARSITHAFKMLKEKYPGRSTLCESYLKHNEVNCCSLTDQDDEGSFNPRGCDCCNGLASTTYAVSGYSPKNKKVFELGEVCGDCLCYFANGECDERV